MTSIDPRAPGGGAGGGMPLGPQFVEPLPPKKNVAMTVVTIIIMVVAAISTLIIVLLAALSTNFALVILSAALAIVTLAFVWGVVWFIDRWEPEPPLLLFAAVAWGAGISTAATLITGGIGELIIPGLPDWWGTAVQAPVLEEFFKGLGVLVIFFAARRHFNSPTDGIVFGALSGGGFAFTENILYFSQMTFLGLEYGVAGGAFALGFQVLVRGIAMPLLHPLCTSLTGAAIGWGARRSGTGGAILGFFVGLVPAMLVHAIWNGGTIIGDQLSGGDGVQSLVNTFLLFLFVMVPIFILWIIMIVLLRRGDRRVIRDRLGEYAQVGWYSQAEVQMLSTMQGRSGARSWARRLGPTARRAMRAFIEDSSRLAHVRHLIVHNPSDASHQRLEHELLSDLTRIRRVLNQSQSAGMRLMQPAHPVAQPTGFAAPSRMPQPTYGQPARPSVQQGGAQQPGTPNPGWQQPAAPQQPGRLGQPGQPGRPNQYGQSSFGQPGQPGQPGRPNQYGQPGQPNPYGQPNQYGQPGQPGQPGYGRPPFGGTGGAGAQRPPGGQ